MPLQKLSIENRIKRIIREVYRLNKAKFYELFLDAENQYGLMFIYSGKREPTFTEIEKSLNKLIKVVFKKIDC